MQIKLKEEIKENNIIEKTETEDLKFIKKQIIIDGAFLKTLKTIDDDLKWWAIKKSVYNIEYIENPTEEMCFYAVNVSPATLQFILNPSDELIIKAIKKKGEVIQYIENPTEEMQLEAVKQNGLSLEYLKNPSEKVQIEAIKNNIEAIRCIKDWGKTIKKIVKDVIGFDEELFCKLTFEEQYQKLNEYIDRCSAFILFVSNAPNELIEFALKKDGSLIKYIINPTEKMKKCAISHSYINIKYIENPSEEMMRLVLKKSAKAIQYIENPTEEMMIEAVKKDGELIKYIDNPSEAVQLEAVKHYNKAIKYFKNPSERVQLEAINFDGTAIQFIENPSEKVQLEAVKRCGCTITDIDNPTEEMKLLAVKQNGYALKYIENPTEEMQIEAVKRDCEAMKYIENPTEEMKLEAVKQNGLFIKYIGNPTEEMKIEAVKQNEYSINYIKKHTAYIKYNWRCILKLKKVYEDDVLEALFVCEPKDYKEILKKIEPSEFIISLFNSGFINWGKNVILNYMYAFKGTQEININNFLIEKLIIITCWYEKIDIEDLILYGINKYNVLINAELFKQFFLKLKNEFDFCDGVIKVLMMLVIRHTHSFVEYYAYYKKVAKGWMGKIKGTVDAVSEAYKNFLSNLNNKKEENKQKEEISSENKQKGKLERSDY